MRFAPSAFRDFERYIRVVVGLDEEDFQLILKQYSSKFVIYKITPENYTIKDTSKAMYTRGDHEETLKIEFEYDEITLKTKSISTRSGGDFGTSRFDERCFFNTLLGLYHFEIISLLMSFMLIPPAYTLVIKFLF